MFVKVHSNSTDSVPALISDDCTTLNEYIRSTVVGNDNYFLSLKGNVTVYKGPNQHQILYNYYTVTFPLKHHFLLATGLYTIHALQVEATVRFTNYMQLAIAGYFLYS